MTDDTPRCKNTEMQPDGCKNTKIHAYGYCTTCDFRIKHGIPLSNPLGKKRTWSDSASIGYQNAHNAVRRARGKAKEHLCVHCGRHAKDWAYLGGAPDEQWARFERDGKESDYPYSNNISYYIPLCKSCHRQMDGFRGEDAPNSVFTEALVKEMRDEFRRAPFNMRERAESLGVVRSAVQNALYGRTWGWLPGAIEERLAPPKGEKHSWAKLTDDTVLRLRREFAERPFNINERAREIGVTGQNLNAVIYSDTWKHLDGFGITRTAEQSDKFRPVLTPDLVRMIRSGTRTTREWSTALGVSMQAIADARSGRTWKNVI